MLFDSLFTAFSSIFKGSSGKNPIYSIKKDMILNDVRGNIDVIKTTLIPMAEDFNINIESGIIKGDVLNKSKYVSTVVRGKVGIKSNASFFRDYLAMFTNIVDNESKILDALSKALPNKVVTDSTVTARELAVLNFSQSLGMLVNFTLDVFLSIAYDVKGGSGLNKKYLMGMDTAAKAYLLVLNDFTNTDIVKRVNEFIKVDSVIVGQAIKDAEGGDKETAEVLASNISDKAFSSLNRDKGWIGNPIYHVRLYFNDREEQKIKLVKAYKAETELIIQNLRQQNEGLNDPAIDKQISYYQGMIEDYQYKISKYEDTL